MNKIFYLVGIAGLVASISFVLPLFQSGGWVSLSEVPSNKKCIARDGSIYYGAVPKGVVCEEIVSVDGAMTVFESQDQGRALKTFRSPREKCDGRRHCSQMTSCSEAKFFLTNCPNTEMDGDGDGVPCERQWCS